MEASRPKKLKRRDSDSLLSKVNLQDLLDEENEQVKNPLSLFSPKFELDNANLISKEIGIKQIQPKPNKTSKPKIFYKHKSNLKFKNRRITNFVIKKKVDFKRHLVKAFSSDNR